MEGSNGFDLLVVGDPGDRVDRVMGRLAARGHRRRAAHDLAGAIAQLSEGPIDLAIGLLPLVAGDGASLLTGLREATPGTPVIVCGTDRSVPDAASAMALGASEHFAGAPPDPNELLASIGLALGARRHDAHLGYLRRKDAEGAGLDAMLGESPPLKRVKRTVAQLCTHVRGAPPAILISGETGTGKGMVAKALHFGGPRRNGAFVDLNCAAIPAQLIESELFGHERGAFTDAKGRRKGLFETADRGTLFLDEIGSMPLELQSRLLKVLEDQRFRRIGSSTDITVDVHVIAASHEDLEALVAAGRFRADLFHRLNVVHIEMPPLRECGDDRILLAERFIESICRRYGIPARRLTDEARRALNRYSFPGNVRELKNIIERAILLESDERIHREHLQIKLNTQLDVRAVDEGVLSVRLPTGSFSLEELERATLKAALERNEGNVSRTARHLQISRQKLIYRLKRHGLRS